MTANRPDEPSVRPEESTALTDPTAIRPWIDLKLTGLLWLLNSSVLHPRGFAFALVRDPATQEIVGWRLLGDGSEPWKFKGVEQGSCDANFADVEALFAAARAGGETWTRLPSPPPAGSGS